VDSKPLCETGDWRVVAAAPVADAAFVRRCCALADGREAGEPITRTPAARVVRFEWRARAFFLKEHLARSWRRRIRLSGIGRRVERVSRALAAAGFSVPAVVCYGVRPGATFVTTEAAEGTESLYDWANARERTPAERREAFAAFGRETARWHAARFVHGDLQCGNVFCRPAPEGGPAFSFIDNDRTRRFRRLPSRERIGNLVQFGFSWYDRADFPGLWDAFVDAYAEASEWDCRARAQKALARRAAKSARRAAKRGRRT